MTDIAAQAPASLAVEYIIPPFTVLDGRQGYWIERKQRWITWGLEGEAGRDAPAYNWHMGGANGSSWEQSDGSHATTSVFDPVLCEIVYQWWSPAGGVVIDPFAGEATKGVIAAKLGRQYYGVELRPEQIAANMRQAERLGVAPTWIAGDSANVGALIPPGVTADLVFTSPPYYDLEVYSGHEADGSAFSTYDRFIAWYADILRQCVDRLAADRFVVLKVGDVRGPDGNYRGFISDTIGAMRDAGCALYNQAVYIMPVGSLAMRTRKQFTTSRKLGMGHQQVLVFLKGDARRATGVMGVVDPDAVESPQLGLFDLSPTSDTPAEYVQVTGDDIDEEDWL